MKAIWLTTLLIIGLVSFSFATQLYAQHDHSEHSMEADAEKGDHSMHDMDSD